mgnify:CR=1 FL=1
MPKASKESASEHETVEGYEGHLEHLDGELVFAHACKLGLEGIVSKRRDSRYEPGRRSRNWAASDTSTARRYVRR